MWGSLRTMQRVERMLLATQPRLVGLTMAVVEKESLGDKHKRKSRPTLRA